MAVIPRGEKILRYPKKDVNKFDEWAVTYDGDFATFGLCKEAIERIVDLVESYSPRYVLDIGTGTGALLLALSRRINAKFIGIDISGQMLRKAKENLRNVSVELKKGSFLSIPINDSSVDVVVSNLAMHHLPDALKIKSIKEIKRVLKTNGKVVIGDIIFFEKFDWRSVTKNNLRKKIAQAFGKEVKPEEFCSSAERILEMLIEEYPSSADDLEMFFSDSGFDVKVEKVKYWVGVIIASKREGV